MGMRLHEIHPAIVHFPIALLPTALGADALGRASGNAALMGMGRRAMALTAVSAAISGVAGLIAQEEVRAEGRARDLLITHRNLNIVFTTKTAALALKRSRRSRPSRGYLAVGLAALGLVSYTGYIGSHMVYEYGVGVKEAGGIPEGASPELEPGNMGDVARRAAGDIRQGLARAAQEIANGELVPALTRGG